VGDWLEERLGGHFSYTRLRTLNLVFKKKKRYVIGVVGAGRGMLAYAVRAHMHFLYTLTQWDLGLGPDHDASSLVVGS